jgi:hypothetical protein
MTSYALQRHWRLADARGSVLKCSQPRLSRDREEAGDKLRNLGNDGAPSYLSRASQWELSSTPACTLTAL